MTAEITTFLLARIAEDEAFASEQVARRTSRSPIHYTGSMTDRFGGGFIHYPGGREVEVSGYPEFAEIIRRYHPEMIGPRDARILAECDVKRILVRLHGRRSAGNDVTVPDRRTIRCPTCIGATHPCLTICAIALPYAAHPDFQKEWAIPDGTADWC